MLAGLAWAYMLWLAADMDMGGMDMSGFRMIPAGMALMVPATAPWNATEFAFVFVMWAVMMVGMMTPSATPMILIYTRVGRQAAQQGKPFAPSSWFAGGYSIICTEHGDPEPSNPLHEMTFLMKVAHRRSSE